jgi:beta-lactam-binding protein with PASTA domain
VASVALVRSATAVNGTGVTTLAVSLPASATVGDYLVVSVYGTNNNSTGFLNANLSTATVADNATGGTNTYTLQTSLFNNVVDNNSNFDSCGAAVFVAPVARTNAGTFTVTVTTSLPLGDTSNELRITVSEWSGVAGVEGVTSLNGAALSVYDYSVYPTITATLAGDMLITSQTVAGNAVTYRAGLGTSNVLAWTGASSVEYISIANARQVLGTVYALLAAPNTDFSFAGIAVLLKSTNAAVASVPGHNVEFAPREFPIQAYDAWTGFPRLPSTRYDGLVYNRGAGAAPVVNGMDAIALPPKTVLYQEWTGFPRGPNPSQSLLFGRQQVAQPSQPWMAYTRPRLPTVESEQDIAQRRTQFYNVAAPTTTVSQPWMAYTRPRIPIVEPEQDTAQRRTWFYNQTPIINGMTPILGYQTTVLYEANDGFPRRPVDNSLLLFNRATPVAAPSPQPFYAYNWGKPPSVTAEEYSVYRTPANFQSFVSIAPINGMVGILGYQTTVLYEANDGFPRRPVDNSLLLFNRTTAQQPQPQPFYAYNWSKPPTVAAEEYSVYRTPSNFFQFIQPVVNGTLAYLAYQTTVLYEANTGFPRPPDTSAQMLLFGRTTPVTPNVYPWPSLGWTKPPTVSAEEYTVRTPFPYQSFYWKTPTAAASPNAWYTLHWQQAVTVEAEAFRVTSPFPYLSFYWKTPYVPPPYPGMTIWDATYQVVNDNMMVYPIEWIMSSTVPYGYVISRTPYPDSAQPNWTYIKMVASAGPPASLGYVTLPSLTPLRAYDASTLLGAIGLTLGTVSYANSPTIPAGFLISQTVAAGTILPLGSVVGYTVSLGVAATTVYTTTPTMTNQTLAIATAAAVQANLIVLPPVYQGSNTVPAGTIISQSPAAGSTQLLWTPVLLVVSSGPLGTPVSVTVPNIVGQTATTGNALLSGVGLVSTNVTYGFQTSIAAGIIVSQSVAAGTSVLVGTTVSYVVSLGPQTVTPTVTVPNVVGTTLTAARNAVVNANLVVGSPIYAASSTVYAETVISQSPAAGVVVSLWTTVNLIVSSG